MTITVTTTVWQRVRGVPPLLILSITAVLLAAIAWTAAVLVTTGAPTARHEAFPTNYRMEQQLGVRFSRMLVVGDGGLVQVDFLVLDADKAADFETSLTDPPVIVGEDGGSTNRISVMKQSGHALVPGQTYYLVYQNTGGFLVPGAHASIVEDGMRIAHIPVMG